MREYVNTGKNVCFSNIVFVPVTMFDIFGHQVMPNDCWEILHKSQFMVQANHDQFCMFSVL